jgi:hypothetical protein
MMIRTAISTSTRTAALSKGATRTIHSTPVASKTVTETVSEVADSVRLTCRFSSALRLKYEQVNKKVGKGLAEAIETGQRATQTTKQKTSEAFNAADQKTNQVWTM